MTPAMVEAVQVYNANPPPWSKRPPPSSEPSFENAVVGNPISHGQVIKLSTHLREQGAPEERHERCSEKLSSYHLDDLLRGSRVYVQPAKPRAEPV